MQFNTGEILRDAICFQTDNSHAATFWTCVGFQMGRVMQYSMYTQDVGEIDVGEIDVGEDC